MSGWAQREAEAKEAHREFLESLPAEVRTLRAEVARLRAILHDCQLSVKAIGKQPRNRSGRATRTLMWHLEQTEQKK